MTDQIQDQDVELDEIDEIEEAHDPKNAEAQSVAAADKATDAGPTAKEPGGKGLKAEPMPKTKAGMGNAMYNKMNKMKKEDLKASYKSMMGEEIELEDEIITSDHSQDLEALIANEEGLAEGFKDKAATIFEAAVSSRVQEYVSAKQAEMDAQMEERVAALEEQFAIETEESLNETREELIGKIDSYLNYVVETWMEENRVAVEKGLRTENAETFMSNLKDLFKESYIEVPEGKVDLVDDLVETIEDLESQVNAKTEQAMAMKEEVDQLRRTIIVREASKGLADTQAAKLEKLAESVEYESDEKFAEKVATLKDSYFGSKTSSDDTIVEEELSTEAEVIKEESDNASTGSDAMSRYISALRTTS